MASVHVIIVPNCVIFMNSLHASLEPSELAYIM